MPLAYTGLVTNNMCHDERMKAPLVIVNWSSI